MVFVCLVGSGRQDFSVALAVLELCVLASSSEIHLPLPPHHLLAKRERVHELSEIQPLILFLENV